MKCRAVADSTNENSAVPARQRLRPPLKLLYNFRVRLPLSTPRNHSDDIHGKIYLVSNCLSFERKWRRFPSKSQILARQLTEIVTISK